MVSDLKIADYTYDLPEHRIAKFPLASREESKILLFKNGVVAEHKFSNAHKLLSPKSLLVFNNTRVVRARLQFEKTKGAKPIEVFCLEPEGMDVERAMAAKRDVVFKCLVGNAKRWTDGLQLKMKLNENGEFLTVEKLSRSGDSFLVKLNWNSDACFSEILEAAGKVPLPPYLKRDSLEADNERYQTVYAKTNGSVAAPTAGLHFTDQVIEKLKSKGVEIAETTLHVGAGTFKPVSTPDVQSHEMHAEEIHVSPQLLEQLLNHKGPLTAVGTTSVRTLESLYWLGVMCLANPNIAISDLKLQQWDAYELPQDNSRVAALTALLNKIKRTELEFLTQTQLLIAPGYKFRMVDALFTNFHQPGSTLILLVAAAVGPSWKDIYQYALENNFRFLSYGDSSLLFIPQENKAFY